MRSGLCALFIGGTVVMSMLAAAFVSIREAELRASSPSLGSHVESSTLG